ncbi:MAG: peptidylprolyl isomerase [Holosporaceae bacterium]|nr:peptidylprolyl isomerase [Holosporaceae bacterium]
MKFISAAAATIVFQFLLCSEHVAAGALKRDFNKDGGDKQAAPVEGSGGSEEKTGAAEGSSGSEEKTSATEEYVGVAESGKQETATSASSETAVPTPKKIEGDPVVLKIGRKVFKRSDVLEAMKSLPPQLVKGIPQDKLFSMVRDQKMSEYLMIEQAKKAGMDKTKEFLDRMEQTKQDLLARLFLLKEISPKTENEQALRARHIKYVAEFKKAKESHLYHIMAASEDQAKKVLEQLKNNADFSAVAEKESTAPSKTSGGDEGFIPLEMLPDPIKGKLMTLKPGEYTKEFIKTEAGFHIFKITETRDSAPQKFEDCKNMLRQMIFQEELMKLMDKLEKQYSVEKFEEDGTPAKAEPAEATTAVQPVVSQPAA